MTALAGSAAHMLAASTALMLLVLVLRAPVRRAIGPRLAYALWALPVVRMACPSLPVGLASPPVTGAASGRMLILAIGAAGDARIWERPASAGASTAALSIWVAGGLILFGWRAARHVRFCARLRRSGAALGRIGTVRLVEVGAEGPLAFGVLRRYVAVPRGFAQLYDARERRLALSHECAHHARGDLVANWVALVALAVHWWNPIAWLASAAFHEDQEYAADAHVLAAAQPSALLPYAVLLAKAAGAGAPPACSLGARSNLKGRLMMLRQRRRPLRHIVVSGTLVSLLGGGALAASTLTPVQPGPAGAKQTTTIGVKPDGSGAYSLIVGGVAVAPGAPLPNGLRLPADFGDAGGCDLSAGAKPTAMAIKGRGRVETYTVMCASAAPADVRATLGEGLASLQVMRTSVAAQGATSSFPEAERTRALAAIDRSIREVQETLGGLG